MRLTSKLALLLGYRGETHSQHGAEPKDQENSVSEGLRGRAFSWLSSA
jgi:hypothetical protein